MPTVVAQAGILGLTGDGVVELIVRGGALGLAFLLAWMSFRLFHDLLQRPKLEAGKVFLAVVFVVAMFGSLVGGALLHVRITNPAVRVTLLVTPAAADGEDLPELRGPTVEPGAKPREFLVSVRQGETVVVEIARLVDRVRGLRELLNRYEALRAGSGEMGANHEI